VLWLGLALEQAGWRTSPYFAVTGHESTLVPK